METFEEILEYQLWGNTMMDYGIAFLIFLGLYIVFRIFRAIVLKKLKALVARTNISYDDEVVSIFQKVPAFFYLVLSLYFPLKWLDINENVELVIDALFLILVVYQVIQGLQRVISVMLQHWAARDGAEDEEVKNAFAGFRLLIRIVLWTLGLLLVLSNLGVNISTLVASLGIGGVAVALALQNILGDIFSSFSIYFDKPFQIGDFVVLGNDRGTVKSIGLKTTRIESLDGEELVVSNRELTSARIQNFKKMNKRRILFDVGVEYKHNADDLIKAKQLLIDAVESVDNVELGRVHLFELGDFSLNFRVVFFVLSQEYGEYMDAQEKINLAILTKFKKEGIALAFPTQKMVWEKGFTPE